MTTEQTSNLSDLINGDRVRSSIRRLFQNDTGECLSELFQNSQRARARRVEIVTSEEGFTYRDDGHGLLGGVEGFHTLLKIAESNFDNETITDQNPMGVGLLPVLRVQPRSKSAVAFRDTVRRLPLALLVWHSMPDADRKEWH
jgi:hypothetical protein